MARQIKNFWLKIGTMFMTLYFMPLSHFIMSIFGHGASDAHAGTITCSLIAGSQGATKECIGVSDKRLAPRESVTCTCPTDSSKIQVLFCGESRTEIWDAMCSCVDEVSLPYILVSECESKQGACSPNGSTKDCSTAAQYGTRTCTNGQWGTCVLGNCKNGYVKIGDVCTASCTIENGTGYEYEESSSSSSTEA